MAKYTDEQIKKALECCSGSTCRTDCPLSSISEIPCDSILNTHALDLINRQEAEYEDLQEQFRHLDIECERLEKANESQEAEIERLRKENKTTERNALISFANVLVTVYSYQPITPENKKVVDVDVIVSLVKALTGKEMVGESK